MAVPKFTCKCGAMIEADRDDLVVLMQAHRCVEPPDAGVAAVVRPLVPRGSGSQALAISSLEDAERAMTAVQRFLATPASVA